MKNLIQRLNEIMEESEKIKKDLVKELQKKFDENIVINTIGDFYRSLGDKTIYAEVKRMYVIYRIPVDEILKIKEPITILTLDNIKGIVKEYI